MDKYEYQVCADQIKTYIEEHRFAEAMEIADKIDWRRVKSVSMLCAVSEVYKLNKKYDESREILLLAYERYPESRTIVYAMCELAIKMNDVVAAVEYYKQYVRLAPEDTNSYILLYKIYEAQDVTLEERIQVLEEFKKRDYREKWAYELAYLYHKVGQESKCVAECDELILWFGEGKYVRKAMELKMEHAELTPEQKRKYEGTPQQQIVEAYGEPIRTAYTGEIPNQQIYDSYAEPYGQQGYAPYQPAQQGLPYGQPEYGNEIQVAPVNTNTGLYSTMNLQEELARSMEEFIGAEGRDPYGNPYGTESASGFLPQTDVLQQMYGQGGEQMQYTPQNAAPMFEDRFYGQQTVTGQIYPEQSYEQPQQFDNRGYEAQQPIAEPPKPKEIVPISIEKKYESILSQEYDGQISLSLPDNDMVEKQITGQLNLDDILGGWANRKREKEEKDQKEYEKMKRQKAEARRRELQNTTDIMSKLEGVIPGAPAADVTYPSTEPAEPILTATGAVHGTMPSGRVLTLEDEYGGNMAKIREEEEAILAERKTGPIPAEEAPEIETSETEASKTEASDVGDETAESVLEEANIETDRIESDPIEAEQTETESGSETLEEAVAEEMTGESTETPEQDPMLPFSDTDYGEVEEIEDIEQPDDLDEILKTSNMPFEEIERIAQERYEAGLEQEEAAAAQEAPVRMNHPSYMTLEDAVKSKREFNEAEQKIFIRFEGNEPLKAQIVEAMDMLSMEPGHGNVVVLGSDLCGRKELALDIVKAIQSRDQIFSGKVAKISGEALNKKNIPITIKKLRKGALIVENAGGLTMESMNIITEALLQETEPVLVVLEGSEDSVGPLLNVNRMIQRVFDARINIAAYSNDDLVAYGRGYAKEQGYSIDDMGVLALYTRIGEMQTLDHVVSVDEVSDIVDAAIKHVDRKNMAHFMDVLLAKRYDDEDYIVLREKDFIF